MTFDTISMVATLASIYIFLRLLLSVTQNYQEPPTTPTTIPFIGPLIGLIRDKEQYYVKIRDKFNLPLYTIRLPFKRIYVVNSRELIPAVQKQWRTLSFAPFSAGAGKILGMSKQSLDIMYQGLTDDDGYNTSWVRRMTQILGPGAALDTISKRTVELFVEDLQSLLTMENKEIGFWEWTRQLIINATSESIYGPQNPLREPKVREAWKIFEESFGALAVSPLPFMLSRKVTQARETCVAAMIAYLHNKGQEEASTLVRVRHDVHRAQYNFNLEDTARSELGNTLATLANTVPAAWWFLCHIFSDPKVLSDIRQELNVCVKVNAATKAHVIDLSCIGKSCPILISTFQEMLRFRAANIGPRMVLEDAVLDGDLLKKGCILMIPASVHHTDISTWGESARDFDHLRFTRKASPGKQAQSRVAFRAFGGGYVLCPGRHFASMQIMALGALLAIQFHVEPVSGQWSEPTCQKSPMAKGLPVPDYDIPVRFHARHPERKWIVTYTGSDKAT
ncbi:cytochrome P450 [Xylariaceae sp. FL1272]|nr:cytochrome P450 [Xylariaceae sp. FL1272]